MGNDENLPRRTRHPELSEEEDKDQRGDSPPESVGHTDPPEPTDADPGWQPGPGLGDEWRRLANDIGKERRPRREDVYPSLLIRAMSPGDRGQRPLWPPTVCWESPDILLIDVSWTGAFTTSQLVASPTAGRSYRVFVRVWNLGLLPAVGVLIRAWYVNPGFFGPGNQNNPYYAPTLIGGAWVQLEDRTRPGAMALVELDHAWDIPPGLTGHECLIASASCPADQWGGSMSVNDDRHIGQRNLEILAPAASAKDMFALLGGLVEKGATLELTHGGPAVLPLLHAVAGGRLHADAGRRQHGDLGERLHGDAGGRMRERERTSKIVAPELSDLRAGVDIGVSQHLLTAFAVEGRSVVVDSARLAALAGELGWLKEQRDGDDEHAVHPFARAGGTRRFIDRLDADQLARVGWTSDRELAESFVEGMARLLDVGELTAGALAARLGGPAGACHLLRLTQSDEQGTLVGGYSLVVRAE